MAQAESGLWTPMSQKEIAWRQKERRQGHPHLEEGHELEQDTAVHSGPGWEEVKATDDGVVELDVLGDEVHPPGIYGPGNTEAPRVVAEDVYGMIWKSAQKSPEAYALFAKVVRHNNPLEFSHLSDDELATKIEQHAKDAARAATEKVYKDKKWDRGNVIGAA